MHVGVHGLADSVQLEMCAHNDGYTRPDESGKKCHHGCCVEGGYAVTCLLCRGWGCCDMSAV